MPANMPGAWYVLARVRDATLYPLPLSIVDVDSCLYSTSAPAALVVSAHADMASAESELRSLKSAMPGVSMHTAGVFEEDPAVHVGRLF